MITGASCAGGEAVRRVQEPLSLFATSFLLGGEHEAQFGGLDPVSCTGQAEGTLSAVKGPPMVDGHSGLSLASC